MRMFGFSLRGGLLAIGVLAALALGACSGFVEAEKTGMLPLTGDFPGLVQIGKNKIFTKAEDRLNYLGSRGRMMEQYGTTEIYVGDYTLGGEQNNLTMEYYKVEGDVGAAGIFYYYQGRILLGAGKEVDIGGGGVLDVKNENRNLYFYKGRYFFTLIYTGKAPVPDLTGLGKYMADKVTARNWKPAGFRYLDGLEGVSQKYTRVSYGNALNMDFLPPAVMSLALCAGKTAKVYVCMTTDPKQLDGMESAFVRYLRFDAKDYKYTMHKVGGSSYKVHQAVEKDEGLILFTSGKETMFIVTGAESVEKGTELLVRLIERDRAESGFKKDSLSGADRK